MIAIYTPYHSARIKYVLDHIFRQQFGLEYCLLGDVDKREEKFALRINYSPVKIEGYLNMEPYGLLEETGIRQRPVEVSGDSGLKTIFQNTSDTGYDLFSAVFYCLSRYEEYGNDEKDEHGRFKYEASFLWKNNCLHVPLVDAWINDLRDKLINKYGFKSTDFKPHIFSVLPTIDVDSAFSYKGRGIVRQSGGFAKSALQGNLTEIVKRFKVVILGSKDPNDNFDYQFRELTRHNLQASYFIQVGAHGRYDKNIDPNNREFTDIIKEMEKRGHTVGLHPSYGSDSDPGIIKKEKGILENIVSRPVTTSRQHYLRFSLPETYRALIAIGIEREFSMGYSEVAGFRAGTSCPFLWYDLLKEEQTNLEIMPFCVMDVAYKQFMKPGIKATIETTNELKKTIRSLGGQYSFVYHNESLSDHRGWEGWREVFEAWLENGH